MFNGHYARSRLARLSRLRLCLELLLVAILVSACSAVTPDVDFCQVLTAGPEYKGRTFRTEIIVVPDYHGRFATLSQCKASVIKFAKGSFAGSPTLQKLDDEVESAYRTRNGPPPLKAVAVRVRARVEEVWLPVPGISSTQPNFVLRLLDCDSGRLVDLPEEILHGAGT